MDGTYDALVDALAELLPGYGWRRCRNRDPEGSVTGMVLHKLYWNGGSLTPGELRDMLSVTGARVTAILKELEGKRLLRRGPAEGDRRSVLVALTEEGRQAVETRLARRRLRAERVVRRLGAEEAETLIRLLRVVRELDDEGREEGGREP